MTEAEREAFVLGQTAPAAPPLVPEVTLHLASAITPIWEATEVSLARSGVEPPYWAFAWPGGQALARFVLDDPALVRDRRVLDFAAGCGLAAIAAAKAGAAHVLAAELDPLAATAARLNAAANGVAIETEASNLLAAPPSGWDVILAGDVCYEARMTARVVPWLRQAADAGTLVLLADPGRAYLPRGGIEAVAAYDVPVTRELEDRELRRTVIYRLSGTSGA
ncbi:class I SAM-dependent methyltransferase [Elioraea rosea]|uniref:class I SAM-dependent methyltransferase n=1 Tax=Elioraea rosea TaxID=2492390 RepID=UPI001183D7D9|nr:50S ribosomal protein L11 methyltransferase [Elioraea rosea]